MLLSRLCDLVPREILRSFSLWDLHRCEGQRPQKEQKSCKAWESVYRTGHCCTTLVLRSSGRDLIHGICSCAVSEDTCLVFCGLGLLQDSIHHQEVKSPAPERVLFNLPLIILQICSIRSISELEMRLLYCLTRRMQAPPQKTSQP